MTEQQTAGERPVTAVTEVPTQPVQQGQERGVNPRRILALNGLALLVLVLIGLGIYYLWHQGYYFYSTDDAAVSGTIVGIAVPAPGVVDAVTVRVGSTVRAGDVVATVRGSSGGTIKATSPINGTIISENAMPGAVVPAGQPLAQVVDLGALAITAYVEENHIGDVSVGQGVDITVDAIKDTTFHGHVNRILPATASTFSVLPTTDYASGNFTKVTQRIPVQITLDGYQGHALYPGESAQATIHIHQ